MGRSFLCIINKISAVDNGKKNREGGVAIIIERTKGGLIIELIIIACVLGNC